jgi:hypothetical protein
MRQDVMAIKVPAGWSSVAQYWRAAARCRMTAYIAATAPLLLMIVLAGLYPDLNQTKIPDWRPLISRADASWNSGDLYQARHLYLQVERAASWRQDWAGLIAAACRINRMDGVNGPYSKAFSILVRAATVAELEQSRHGVATVAKSLSLLGAQEAAAAILARIQPSWPNETVVFDDLAMVEGCSAITARPTAKG